MPLLGAAVLVGCGDAAADDTCSQLREYEQRSTEIDPEDPNTSDVLAETYDDVENLAEHSEGEVGGGIADTAAPTGQNGGTDRRRAGSA